MMTSTTYFVESEGIRLPDGTVFGAGIEPKITITRGENGVDYFKAYYVIGKERVPAFDECLRWEKMLEWLIGEARHYAKHGMKLWAADNSDWSKATYKKLVDENY